ncbi:S41 family peptidase [Candidatus Roizmanbacteria bacterium]|nr:S41 family peptidase [Candidatus Roizmanbacteria bacterium]
MNNKLRSLQIIIIIAISTLVGYYFGVNKVNLSWKNYQPSTSVINKEAPASVSNVDFSLFWKVWQRLEGKYYDKTKLNPQKMLTGAIEGMTQSLEDPYTIFLPPVQNNNFKTSLAGQFSGIGAELGMREKQIIVVAPLVGSPAEKAGLKSGDAILKVDDNLTINWSLSSAVEKIRGPKGTTVKLTILREEPDRPFEIKIARDTITVKSVDGWIKKVKDIEGIKDTKSIKGSEESKIGYIRLSQFGDKTNEDWIALINKLDLERRKDQSLEGFILDLRNNPGGYLSDAIFVASEFLRQGTPVVIEENGQGGRNTLSVSRKGLFYDTKLVILINKGSASASEIVSGALKDSKRARLIGETSFGKGTIQEANDLGNGAGLHVTIAKWLTPNGTWVHGTGLKPDIEVLPDSKDQSHDAQLEKAVSELLK